MPHLFSLVPAAALVLSLGLDVSPTSAAAVAEKPAPAAPAPAAPGPDLVAANPGGSFTLIAVITYDSVHGRTAHDRLTAFARQNPDIKIIVKPTPSGGPLSEFLAKAAYVTARQGKFLAFHEAALTSPQAHTWYSLRDHAPALGIDWRRFQQDFMDPAVAEAVRANAEFAKQNKVDSAPALIAGGQVFAGPWQSLNTAQVAVAAKGAAR